MFSNHVLFLKTKAIFDVARERWVVLFDFSETSCSNFLTESLDSTKELKSLEDTLTFGSNWENVTKFWIKMVMSRLVYLLIGQLQGRVETFIDLVLLQSDRREQKKVADYLQTKGLCTWENLLKLTESFANKFPNFIFALDEANILANHCEKCFLNQERNDYRSLFSVVTNLFTRLGFSYIVAGTYLKIASITLLGSSILKFAEPNKFAVVPISSFKWKIKIQNDKFIA